MKKWKIWFQWEKPNGTIRGGGVLPNVYKHKSSAVRYARKHFANAPYHKWAVSQTNPMLNRREVVK